MSYSLVITERSSTAQTLGSTLRNAMPDRAWKVISSSGYWMDWPKTGLGFNVEECLPELVIKNKNVLNKVLLACREADRVYLANQPSDSGELAAYFLKQHIVGQQPERVVKRLKVRELTTEALRAAIEADQDIDDQLVERELSRMLLDRVVTTRIVKDHPIGRAMAPVLACLVNGSTTGQRITATFRSGFKNVKFRSGLVDDPEPVLAALKQPIEFHRDVEEDLSAPPPYAMSTIDLLVDGAAELGFKSIEVLNQARELYGRGVITYPFEAGHGISPKASQKIASRIEILADPGRRVRIDQQLHRSHLGSDVGVEVVGSPLPTRTGVFETQIHNCQGRTWDGQQNRQQ